MWGVKIHDGRSKTKHMDVLENNSTSRTQLISLHLHWFLSSLMCCRIMQQCNILTNGRMSSAVIWKDYGLKRGPEVPCWNTHSWGKKDEFLLTELVFCSDSCSFVWWSHSSRKPFWLLLVSERGQQTCLSDDSKTTRDYPLISLSLDSKCILQLSALQNKRQRGSECICKCGVT